MSDFRLGMAMRSRTGVEGADGCPSKPQRMQKNMGMNKVYSQPELAITTNL